MNNEEEIISLKNELEKTKEHLKKYTAPACKNNIIKIINKFLRIFGGVIKSPNLFF